MTQPETIKSRALRREDVLEDPFTQFRLWFSDARSVQTILPEAMSIATVSTEGRPASRMVLLKELDESFRKAGDRHSPNAKSWTDRVRDLFK